MTIKEVKQGGSPWYGWGITRCHTCPSKFGHVILEQHEQGNYENSALTQAQIASLLETARAHNDSTGGDHEITVNIYQKEEL